MNTQIKNSKKGFTLVELVVVIAILAILAAVAIPVVSSIISTASKNGALSDAQTIELAIKEAQADYTAKNADVYKQIVSIKPCVKDVMDVKKIEAAFESKVVNNETYEPWWNTKEDDCVFICTTAAGGGAAATYKDVEGNTISATDIANYKKLATTKAVGATVTVTCEKVDVINWDAATLSAIDGKTIS